MTSMTQRLPFRALLAFFAAFALTLLTIALVRSSGEPVELSDAADSSEERDIDSGSSVDTATLLSGTPRQQDDLQLLIALSSVDETTRCIEAAGYSIDDNTKAANDIARSGLRATHATRSSVVDFDPFNARQPSPDVEARGSGVFFSPEPDSLEELVSSQTGKTSDPISAERSKVVEECDQKATDSMSAKYEMPGSAADWTLFGKLKTEWYNSDDMVKTRAQYATCVAGNSQEQTYDAVAEGVRSAWLGDTDDVDILTQDANCRPALNKAANASWQQYDATLTAELGDVLPDFVRYWTIVDKELTAALAR